MNAFLTDDGLPNLSELITTFQRCAPTCSGGLAWLDDVRFCRWSGQSADGRKYDVKDDPLGGAKPWNGASDCRPYVVDDIINETKDTLSEAFWRALARPGMANDEAGAYAVALADHLIWTKLYGRLVREVELSAQYAKHYGWYVLAPRWRREVGLKRKEVTLAQIQAEAAQAPPESPLALLPAQILDPSLEEAAVNFFQGWYDAYVRAQLPEDLRARAPQTKRGTVQRVVRELRSQGRSSAPLPVLTRNEAEVCALKPWDEVFLPPEVVDEQTIVFQREWVSEEMLRGRILTEDYSAAAVEAAVKFKGQGTANVLPTGTEGQALRTLTGARAVYAGPSGDDKTGLIEIVHAVYWATDEDDVPAAYLTTFQPQVQSLSAGNTAAAWLHHDLVDTVHAELPYVAGTNEWWCRAIAASRSVPETAHTDQNLVKGFLDGIIDRSSFTLMPPLNVYEDPLTAPPDLSPGGRNYYLKGREPYFMDLPGGQGLVDGLEALKVVSARLDNRYGLMSPDVAAPRIQTHQAGDVRRFLLTWTRALQQLLCLCQQHMADEEFARITGAPDGWLEARRQMDGLLACALHFDVRELDPELLMKQIEAVNKTVIPSDTLNIIDRPKWIQVQLRGINPAWARELARPVADASQALRDKAQLEVLKMFAGNAPTPLDKDDPTAEALLQNTVQIVQSNPNYLMSLSDEALIALAGPQTARLLAQSLGAARQPDERFSALLTEWLKHLQFLGVTQVENKAIGRQGARMEQL